MLIAGSRGELDLEEKQKRWRKKKTVKVKEKLGGF